VDAQFEKALDDMVEWMTEHEAGEIADNLAAPATESAIAAVERRFGAPLVSPLRELYLRHDGQRDRDTFPLLPNGVLTDLAYARDLREGMFVAYFGVVDFRAAGSAKGDTPLPTPLHADGAPLPAAEQTFRWWPLAEIFGGGFLAVNLDTGRVFEMRRDVPPIVLRADSVPAFFAAYADDLWNDRYVVSGDPSLPGVRHEGFVARRKHLAPRRT